MSRSQNPIGGRQEACDGRGELTRLLRMVVARRFEGVALSHEADFWPMYSIDSGELSSSAAIEIARSTKQNAQTIADQILGELRRHVQAEWRNDRGYLVGWGFEPRVLLSEVEPSADAALERLAAGTRGQLRRVWCLTPDSTEPTYARVRLVARAALQALLAVLYEGRVELAIQPLPAQVVTTPQRVLEGFKAAVMYILTHAAEQRLTVNVPEGLQSEGARTVTVWTTHHYHERLVPALRNSLSKARSEGHIRLVMPEDGWLLSRDRALSELLSTESLARVVKGFKEVDGWSRFLFHAASTVPSGDFDPAVSLFDECASTLWSLRLLRERFKRFSMLGELPVGLDTAGRAVMGLIQERKLSVQALLLPVYTARAIVYAEVGEWCEAIERICQRGHAFINAPQTRLAIEKGALDEQSCEIAASLGFGLSSILPVLMEDACRDQ